MESPSHQKLWSGSLPLSLVDDVSQNRWWIYVVRTTSRQGLPPDVINGLSALCQEVHGVDMGKLGTRAAAHLSNRSRQSTYLSDETPHFNDFFQEP